MHEVILFYFEFEKIWKLIWHNTRICIYVILETWV